MNEVDVDKESTAIRCAECNRKLLQFLVKDPNVDKVVNIKAKCPFCVGSSAIQHIVGLVYVGPITSDLTASPVKVVDIDYNDGVFTYILKKG